VYPNTNQRATAGAASIANKTARCAGERSRVKMITSRLQRKAGSPALNDHSLHQVTIQVVLVGDEQYKGFNPSA